MNSTLTIETVGARETRSICCDARVSICYRTCTTEREALVYTCLKCQRLYVLDSRDESAVKS